MTDAATIAGRIIRSHLPARHRDASIRPGISPQFDAALATARAAIAAPRSATVLLCGPRGTGKTQLAAELIRDAAATCCERSEPCYRTAFMLFAEMRDTMRKDASVSELGLISRYTRAKLLVIDEAHERGESAWEDRTLTAILDARYGANMATVIIANGTPEAMHAALRESVVSRAAEGGGVIVCDWGSFRGS